eukprot:ANDGO_01494.mRNA.1 hypothetical protein
MPRGKSGDSRPVTRLHVLSGHLNPSELIPQLRELVAQFQSLDFVASSQPPAQANFDRTDSHRSIKRRRVFHEFIKKLYLVGSASPFVGSLMLSLMSRSSSREPWRRTISNAAGLQALEMMTAQAILGARLPVFEKTFGLDKTLAFHRLLGYAAIGLASMHGVLKASKFVNWSLSPQFPFLNVRGGLLQAAAYLTTTTGLRGLLLGRSAIWLMVLIVVTALARRLPVRKGYLPHMVWKPVHYLAYAATLCAYAHALAMMSPKAVNAKMKRLTVYANIAAFAFTMAYRTADLAGMMGTHQIRRIQKVEKLTYDVTRVTLDSHRGQHSLAGQRAGQFAIISKDIASPVVRPMLHSVGLGWSEPHPFTISSAPDQPLQFTIKTMPGGRFSNVVPSWKVGEYVHVEGPYGAFLLDTAVSHGDHVVMIAGGVGVTPFLSWLEGMRHLPKHRLPKKATLIWGIKDGRDLSPAFLRLFSDIHRIFTDHHRDPTAFRVVLLFSVKDACAQWIKLQSESTAAEREAMGVGELLVQHARQGFFGNDLVRDLFLKETDVRNSHCSYWFCGPPVMTPIVARCLDQVLGVAPSEVHYEYFAW